MRYVGRRFYFAYPCEFTTLPDYTARRGQRVKVLGRVPRSETDTLMYRIETPDGWKGEAWPDELTARKPAPCAAIRKATEGQA